MNIEELLIESGAVQFGEFTLASGAKSDVYVDVRKACMNSEYAGELGTFLWSEVTRPSRPNEVVVGVPEGGIPLVTLVMAHDSHANLLGGWVRTKNKTHGNKGQLAGEVYPGDRVVLLDDVVTTGESVMQAMGTLVMNYGISIDYVLSVVDRYEKGNPFRVYDVPFRSLTNLTKLRDAYSWMKP